MATILLESAIDRLLSLSAQSPKRLEVLADYVKQLLERNGLPGAWGGSTKELSVSGLARTKNWDVAYEFAGKFRLLVSLKSMLKNISGSVPNRLDDLQGELANIQQLWPEVVIGYVVLFDVALDSRQKNGGLMWSSYFENAINNISIRRAPLWNQGLLEASWFIRFDSRMPAGRRIIDPRTTAKERTQFVRGLLWELHRREPAVHFTRAPKQPKSVPLV